MVAQIVKKQIEKIDDKEKKIFQILFLIFVFLIIFYGFLVNSTIMNMVSKQKIEKEMMSLSSKVNSLEFVYLNIKNSITLELAQTKGFVLLSSDKFAIIDSTQKNLSVK
ncbi:MAG: hypothetical protein V1910_00775 [bacterium]